jgi:hypothetical protein
VKEFGDMSISDILLCEHYQTILRDEINTLDTRIYNEGLSPIRIDWMLKDYKDSVIQEVDKGEIPEYMKTRVRLSDEMGTAPKVTQTEVQIPPDTPTNSVDELTDSIDEKMDTNTDKLGEMLGANATKDGKNIVINITNNYNNSFNRDDHSDHSTHSDLSTGKNINKSNNVTTTHTNSHNTTNSDKSLGSNNNNNSNSNNDTKETKVQEFASGYSVDDVFAFLESEEPLSTITEATKPPKGSQTLTNAMMDLDKSSRSLQQKSKRSVQKGIGSVKTLLKPAMRTKQWLAGIVDSLIKRNEDTVKTELIESPGYRSTIFKASRLALKLGMFGIAFTINPYIGAAYAALETSRFIDKDRLRREVEGEMAAEIDILDYKIEEAKAAGDVKAVSEMKRLRAKMTRITSDIPRSVVKHGRSVS